MRGVFGRVREEKGQCGVRGGGRLCRVQGNRGVLSLLWKLVSDCAVLTSAGRWFPHRGYRLGECVWVNVIQCLSGLLGVV